MFFLSVFGLKDYLSFFDPTVPFTGFLRFIGVRRNGTEAALGQ